MLGGANLVALRNTNGDWEIIQFQTAELVDAQTYRLSGLLRGQFGTEGAIGDPLAAGAQFVLLDGAVTRVPLQESEQKLTLNWRYGPGNRDIGDASYVTVPFSYQCARAPAPVARPRQGRALIRGHRHLLDFDGRVAVATTGSFPKCRSAKKAKATKSISSTARP